ncbi:M48 family metalloprotease [Archangium lipolyticum]|uniref:M48 family metalloprotease n=1 Tax=Archangium lipolyticum TaxID=2970465 RepID=UPI00214A8876|nr:M48 family metalloprotease [Archangium lipolyticum]
MNRRRWPLLVSCLFLCGFGTCKQYLASQQEADRRADEMQKECDAMKNRVISFEEEQSFGGAVSVNWVSRGGGLTTHRDAHALHVQLNKIGKNLAAQSSRPTLPWTFGVLQSEGVNAVSGPGGYVFVSEGLLAQLDNEAQLAGVLAHEIAHITGKHALHEYQDYLLSECEGAVRAERASALKETASQAVAEGARQVKKGVGSEVQELSRMLAIPELRDAFTKLGSQMEGFKFDDLSKEFIQAITNGFVARITEKGFRQEDEFAADTEAVELMAAAGYAPEEYVAFLSKLPDSGLSTAHPSKQKRQSRLTEHLKKLRKSATDDEFTTSVDLSQTKVVPLRDTLQSRRTGTTAHSN